MIAGNDSDGRIRMTSVGSLINAKSTQPVIYSVSPGQMVREALEQMKRHDIGCVMVMENDELVGILSERDYARKMILAGRTSHDTAVRDIMTVNVICTTPQGSVDECLGLMNEHGFRHLPVKDGNRVVGMVSTGDLISCIIKEQQNTIDQLQQYIAS
jgi:CBS domain-containing protein